MVTPRKLTPRVLTELVGAEHARLLMEQCGGKRIPRLSPARRERELLRAEIIAELKTRTYREVAESRGMPISTVESIANRLT